MPETCPHCSADLRGLGTYCTACGKYTDEGVEDVARKVAEKMDAEGQPHDVTFSLPWEVMVSTNKRQGGMVGWSTKEYRQKRDTMAALFEAEYDGAPHEGEVTVSIELYPPDRRSDPHNFCKVIYDALQHAGVVKNDRSITRWRGDTYYGDGEPRVFVEVTGRESREVAA